MSRDRRYSIDVSLDAEVDPKVGRSSDTRLPVGVCAIIVLTSSVALYYLAYLCVERLGRIWAAL